jgi:protein-disulfide isomerase
MINRKKRKWFWNIWILPVVSLLFAAPAADASASDEVIATLDGKPIYLSEIEESAAFQVYRLKASIHSLLEREAREIADGRLLAAEAARRGLTVEALMRQEVDGKVSPLTEKEVDGYFEVHPEDKLKGPQARERIRVYLAEHGKAQRKLDFMASLREKSDYRFLAAAPARPRIKVDTAGSPSRGTEKASVVLVHFAHFSSSLCSDSADKIREVMAAFPGRIRWVHRDFFGIQDPDALYAAEMGRAAFEEGKFWEYHDRMMVLKGKVTQQTVDEAAKDLKLDRKRIGSGQKEGKYLLQVKEDIGYGVRIGIQAAPVIFVNGIYFSGTFPYEELKRLVERELNQ